MPLPRSPRARPIDITFSVRSEKYRGSTAFLRFTTVPLALSNNIAPSFSVSLSISVFHVKKRSISYPGYSFLGRMLIFFALTSVLFPISHPPSFPFSSPLPFCHTTAYIRIWVSSSDAHKPVSPSHLLFSGARCFDRGPRSSLPLSHSTHLSSFPSSPSSTRDPSTFDSPRASRRRLAEIFSLLPSRNEQCGGSGMQDGRRTL